MRLTRPGSLAAPGPQEAKAADPGPPPPPAMAYRTLGRTGTKVSTICLGTMMFGEKADGGLGLAEPAAHEVLNAFYERGGNFLDTADVYSGGESESIIGAWFEAFPERRADVVVASKVYFPSGGPGPNRRGLGRTHILTGVDEQLARLKTDYLDLLQIHSWDAETAVDDWLQTFKALLDAGKIRMWGVCNVTGWQLQKIIGTAEKLGMPAMASCQMQYSLLCRQVEWEVLDCCEKNDISFLPWSPLKGGWLTGKMKPDAPPPAGTRVGQVSSGAIKKLQSNPSYDQFANDDKVWALLDAMGRVGGGGADGGGDGGEGGEDPPSLAPIAIAWLLKRPCVASVLIGPKRLSQLDSCLTALGVDLSDDDMAELCRLSAVEPPYPYEMNWRLSRAEHGRLDGNLWPLSTRL